MSRLLLVCFVLAGLTAFAFRGVSENGFTNYDDNDYVTENAHVLEGLSADGVAWAFTRAHSANYHPLTWIAHMLDVEFYGLDAGAHHLSNLAVHIVAVVLLFLLGWRMTGHLWLSAWVAALFAIHPMHVESVTWIAERKDTLSTVFGLLCTHLYVSYVRKPRPALYAAVLVSFALGLLSKPMLVTLPAVFLLLDVWPLRRSTPWPKRVVEKLPMVGLVVLSSVATLIAQRAGRATHDTETLPMLDRFTNAVTSTVTYLGKLFAPLDLAVFYPHPGFVESDPGPSTLAVAGAILLLLTISAGAVWAGQRRGWWALPVGWFFYLGTLVPVVGILQVGQQSMADRYTYVPYLGLFLILAALLHALAQRGTVARNGAIVLAMLSVIACVPRTQSQVKVWENSATLWGHALAVTENNWLAHNNLGNEMSKRGRELEALRHYESAIAIQPTYALGHYNRGSILIDQGKTEEGIAAYRRALECDPRNAPTWNNLGNQLALKGQFAEAEEHFERALELAPGLTAARVNLAYALLLAGRLDDANVHYEKLVEIDPNQPRWQQGLASSLLLRDPIRALEAAEKATQLSRRADAGILEVLARALGANGHEARARKALGDAIVAYERADRPQEAQRLRSMLEGMTARSPSP